MVVQYMSPEESPSQEIAFGFSHCLCINVEYDELLLLLVNKQVFNFDWQ